MVNYRFLVNRLTTIAKKQTDLFVYFGTDIDVINRNDFTCPALIISPVISSLLNNSVVQYGFQLIYLSKINQEEDNFTEILEKSFQVLLSYISVVDLEFKVLKDNVQIEPIILMEGGTMMGSQTTIYIQDQYNLDKFKSVFYV